MKENKIPHFVKIALGLYLLFLATFSILRIVLLFNELDFENIAWGKYVLGAMKKGFMFDTLIIAYLLVIPYVIWVISEFYTSKKSLLYKASMYITIFGIVIALMVGVANVAYFEYFQSHITQAVLSWMGTPGSVLSLIFSESQYLISLILFLIATSIIVYIVVRIFRSRMLALEEPVLRTSKYVGVVLLSALVFLSLRGRIDAPLREGDAFFSVDPFYNQLGLNPVFTFIKSISNKVSLMDDRLALENSHKYLQADNHLSSISPIARYVKSDTTGPSYNVVLVLMESMSAAKLSRFGNPNNLTPHLDSIARSGISFDNIYSAGIHTNNGVFSTLYSLPALKRVRPMATVPINSYHGWPHVLRNEGYQTMFFTTHDPGFDNLAVFTKKNAFDTLYSSEIYPKEKSIGTYGVPDDYMFEFAIEELNKKASNNKPFFATMLTTSDHPPYALPTNIPFKPKHGNIKEAIVEYADWSIGKMLKLASKQPWFKNTVFVFVADHGAIVGKNYYDLTLSYHHIPFIVYAPEIFKPTSKQQLGGQIDVFPTVMGLLNKQFVNNTMGVDLNKTKREAIYFSADNKIACISAEWLYVIRDGGKESLYKYKENDLNEYIDSHRSAADSLKNIAFSHIQATEWLILNQKTAIYVSK